MQTPNAPLVPNPGDIRLAMIGMVPGNGHPFSWSVILNGRYQRQAIIDGGYPNICDYIDKQPASNLGIPGAQVTHVCCDSPEQSRLVAQAAGIAHVVGKPEDVLGQVDAVIIATDIGSEHVARARPFIEAGLPVFIDKPLADASADLEQFIQWRREGKALMSSSGLRYASELIALRQRVAEVGQLRAIIVLMCKSWERYGIHAIECVHGCLPAGGCEWVANTSDEPDSTVHLHHASGVDVLLVNRPDLYGTYGQVTLVGTQATLTARSSDTFGAFKAQLMAFIQYLRTGQSPFPFEETAEQIAIVIAGIESRQLQGKRVMVRRYQA